MFTPSVRSQSSGVSSRNGAGASVRPRDEDVEPAVALDDLGDERLRVLDLGEIRRMRRRSRPEPRDRRPRSLSGRSTHATRAPAAMNASAHAKPIPWCAGDERDAPVELPRSGALT